MKMLSATQQTQEEVERTKQQLSFEIDRIKQESDLKVCGVTKGFHVALKVAVWMCTSDPVFLTAVGGAEV